MSTWIGRTISKVVIEEFIGRGGMAEVFRGRHTTLNRPVAVKLLHAHLSDEDTLLTRFKTEAQAVATLRHTNIVQVFDFDVIEDRPYMVMELIEGLNLQVLLKSLGQAGRRMTPQEVAQLVGPLASALDYAHKRGIVHRDIKPANVMLRSESGPIDPLQPLPADTQPVLMDFGIARIADAGRMTASGALIGTPAYMSPEQVQSHPIDARSDIYSFGIMIYEMLSGELPFDADTQASLILAHITEPPKPLNIGNAQLQRVIDRALSKRPEERWQTAGALSSALSDVLRGLPVTGTSYIPVRGATPAPPTIEITGPVTPPGHETPPATLSGPTMGGTPIVWVGAGLGALALVAVIVLAALVLGGGIQPITEPGVGSPAVQTATHAAEQRPATPAFSGTPVGEASINETELTLSLPDLPAAPENGRYEAWLIGPTEDPVSLGPVAPGDTLELPSPDGSPLLPRFTGIAISVEPAGDEDPALSGPIAFEGQLDDEILDHLRILTTYTLLRDAPFEVALLEGLQSQAGHHDSHLGFALDGIESGSLENAKTHGEHVVNIIAGAEGAEFADWNGDGRADNPGDGVGLRTYLLLLRDASSGAGASAQALRVQESTEAVLQKVEESLLRSRSLTSQDTLEGARELASVIEGMRVVPEVESLISQAEEIELTLRFEIRAAR